MDAEVWIGYEPLLPGFCEKETLEHHGVKGQKWGVRRYQNPDGSRTALGKKHEGYSDTYEDEPTDIQRGLVEGKKYKYKILKNSMFDYAINENYSRSEETEARRHAEISTKSSLDVYFGMRSKKYTEMLKNKEVFEKEREECELDGKTGLLKKSREMSTEEDLKRVNVEFADFKSGSKNNCTMCSVAYDLRRRGFEVQAKRASVGYFDSIYEEWYPGGHVVATPNWKHTERSILAEGEGARGVLTSDWKATGTGHAVAYEVRDGKVHIMDAQCGESDVKMSDHRQSNFKHYRFDNLEPDWELLKKEVVR